MAEAEARQEQQAESPEATQTSSESAQTTAPAGTQTATTTAPASTRQTSAPQQRRVARGGRRYGRRRRVCAFCADHITYVDYKQVDVLSRYISERGQIRPRRKTGLCAKHQRRLAVAIKRARHLALLPFTGEHIRLAARYQG